MPVSREVTKFLDYREFLLAYAQEQKGRNPRWTFGVWAKKLGLKGTASLTRILQGQRHPGDEMIERLVGYFAFDQKSADYFRDLVRLHKVRRDPRLALVLIEKMGKDQPDSAIRHLDEKTLMALEAISSWFWPVLCEIAAARGFDEDPRRIAAQMVFEAAPREIAATIDRLVELGLLRRDGTGRLVSAEGRLNTNSDVASEAVKRYHEEMLARASEALRIVEVERREITSQCLLVREDRLPEAKALIREFQDKFAKLMETKDGDAVYQMQIQLFPMARVST